MFFIYLDHFMLIGVSFVAKKKFTRRHRNIYAENELHRRKHSPLICVGRFFLSVIVHAHYNYIYCMQLSSVSKTFLFVRTTRHMSIDFRTVFIRLFCIPFGFGVRVCVCVCVWSVSDLVTIQVNTLYRCLTTKGIEKSSVANIVGQNEYKFNGPTFELNQFTLVL